MKEYYKAPQGRNLLLVSIPNHYPEGHKIGSQNPANDYVYLYPSGTVDTAVKFKWLEYKHFKGRWGANAEGLIGVCYLTSLGRVCEVVYWIEIV